MAGRHLVPLDPTSARRTLLEWRPRPVHPMRRPYPDMKAWTQMTIIHTGEVQAGFDVATKKYGIANDARARQLVIDILAAAMRVRVEKQALTEHEGTK